MIKKVLTWSAVAFVIFFVAYRPQSAANVFRAIGGGIRDIGSGFSEFFSNLVS
jgi:hypothetical protein